MVSVDVKPRVSFLLHSLHYLHYLWFESVMSCGNQREVIGESLQPPPPPPPYNIHCDMCVKLTQAKVGGLVFVIRLPYVSSSIIIRSVRVISCETSL